MRAFIAAISAAVAVCALPAPASAQAWDPPPATDDAETRAAIVTNNSFFLVDDLNFGDIIAGTTPSVIRLQPNGTRTVVSGNAVLVNNNHRPARFAGKGRRNQFVLISVSSSTIQLTGPGPNMTVSQFEIGSTPTVVLTPTPLSFRINGTAGVFNFPVGARLSVGANQPHGLYTGQFEVILDFQ
ncbi:MAG: DUF4402 domain-containing protein [Pseudanabaena sp. CRU_2_10]|nr:DUF4402 domain-containing protein [Pseudanabaena sp. CRU_2_10]